MIKRLIAILFVAALLLSTNLNAQTPKKGKKDADAQTTGAAPSMKKTSSLKLKTNLDSIAYVIGYNWGNMLKRDSIMVNMDVITKAITDALYSGTQELTEAEMQAVFSAFQKEYSEKQQKKAEIEKKKKEEEGTINKTKGDAFLEKNKKEAGVKVTASGLQYKVVKTGAGKSPTDSSEVTVHYTGTLIDGTKFDSSVDRNEPATFPVGGVIKGWTEALKMMKEGDKWMLYIPPELAYGADGRPGIPANSVLVFEVELIKVGK